MLGPDRGVIGVSAAAEALLRGGTHLTMRAGRLVAVIGQCEAALGDAFRQTLGVGGSAGTCAPIKLVLAGTRDQSPMVVELHRLPDDGRQAPMNARILLTTKAKRPKAPSPTIDALRKAFDMTEAEAAVADLLALGHDVSAIASRRGVSVETIRTQLKSAFHKTGTHRQAELVIALAPFR
ncbi:MAG: LuxR family transcriptional regulator [Sphingomonas sp.]|nr:MAG: LuxR family transcriptional regulator [Sphingomonas sp.]